MRYRVTIEVDVDPEANFLGCDENWAEDIISELMSVALYDIDDVIVRHMEVEPHE